MRCRQGRGMEGRVDGWMEAPSPTCWGRLLPTHPCGTESVWCATSFGFIASLLQRRPPPAPGMACAAAARRWVGMNREGRHQLYPGSPSPPAGTALATLPWWGLQALPGLVASSDAVGAAGLWQGPRQQPHTSFCVFIVKNGAALNVRLGGELK